MIVFMMTRLLMYLETSCTYSKCKSRLEDAVEKRRGGEGRAVLSPLVFLTAAHIREWAETGLINLQYPMADMHCLGIQGEHPDCKAFFRGYKAIYAGF